MQVSKLNAILPAFLISAAFMADAADHSRILGVEVYPSGAAVTRELSLEPSGEDSRNIRVEGLPSSLLPSSIRISAAGGAPPDIGSFQFLPNENPVRPDDPRTQDLRDQLRELDTQLREIREQRDLIQSRISHYEGLAQAIRESLKEEAGEEAYDLALKAWESMEDIKTSGNAAIADLGKREEDLKIRRQEIQEDLNEKTQQLQKVSGVLEFSVSGTLSEGVTLNVEYQVREAGWNPVYEVRAIPDEETIEWVYKARIRQQTGEDWSGVQAVLKSTAALYAGDLPDLPPIYLDRREERKEEAYKLQAFSVRAADAAPAGAPAPEQEMAQPASTTASFLMELPQPLSLPSGREPVVREAFSKTLEADFWSEAVPALSTDAWLMAGTTNDLGWPILAGETYAYIDGQLVARKFTSGFGAGEDMEFPLGKNEKIAIERNELLRRESETGLIGKNTRHEIKYETVVTNNMDVTHRIVLKDRFPVSRNEEIEVKRSAPEGVEPEEGTGIFDWERTVQPGSEAVMITEYTVTYPADWAVSPGF